jgi:uncharacterized integral membrane protein
MCNEERSRAGGTRVLDLRRVLTTWAILFVPRFLACIVLLFAAALAYAQTATELKVTAVDPAPDALLARQQPFYVRFEVKSAAPAAVSVRGFFKGNAVIDNVGMSAPVALPAGGGAGVVSLFYWGEQPTRIDEVRLKIINVATGAPAKEYAFPVALTWLTDDPPPREPAAWVKEWQQAQRNRSTAASGVVGPPFGFGTWAIIAAGVLITVFAMLGFWRRRTQRPSGDADASR